jgi:hypothetical protein
MLTMTTPDIKADPKLIKVLDEAILEEWKVTIDNAVRVYLGDDVALPPNMTQHANITTQLARYLTQHEMDYNKNGTAQVDEVDDILLARMYHFLRWQSHVYDIWVR